MPVDMRALLAANEDAKKLADMIEAAAPGCACEAESVGEGSPGPVSPDELLHRILASPRDYDPISKKILERPFRKVYENGLSVWREQGPVSDVKTLMEEALARDALDEPKTIYGVLEVLTQDVHGLLDDNGNRAFCVYDQTVSRAKPNEPPVPTHAGIFQRSPVAGTPNRGVIQKDLAGKLRVLFEKCFIGEGDYQGGLCSELNERSRNGDFVR